MQLLYVTPYRPENSIGGREQLSAIHFETLQGMPGDTAERMSLAPAPAQQAAKGLSLMGWIDGVTRASCNAVIAQIDHLRADVVWLDGTNLGRLAQAIKSRRPKVRILCFAHNVETTFFRGAVRRGPSLRKLGVLVANWIAEKMSIRYADTLIALNQRDSKAFLTIFGRAADCILPMIVAERPREARDAPPARKEPYLLFVGGSFYANQQGILWYSKNVAPFLPVPTLVVGKGMSAMKDAIELPGKLEVVGQVDDLAPWYRGAIAVVAPIFDGSGMKTKVAEALMHGKAVVGTPEAFVGYDVPASCRSCEGAVEMSAAISEMIAAPPLPYDDQLRSIYEQNYSRSALVKGLTKILQVAR